MIKLFPAGLMTLAASAVLMLGAVEASGQQGAGFDRHGINKKSTTIVDSAKKVEIHQDHNAKKSSGVVIDAKKSNVIVDAGKKGNVIVDTGKKGNVIIDPAKKGTVIVDSGKKGTGVIVDPAKKGPAAKDGKGKQQQDLYCKPYCKPHCNPWWGGWCGPCGPWVGPWGCNPWWIGGGTWCAPGCGWFGGWCPPMGETIIIETPIVGGYGPMPGPIVDPGVGPGPGPIVDPGVGPGAGPGAGPGGDPAAGFDPAAGSAEMKVQTKRFLKLTNESGEKLQVFVQYVVKTEDGDAMWFPGEPASEKALTFVMEPGQELFVENNGKKMASPVVRIWAVSAKGQFLAFRGQDLWLVPEQDQNGQHVYLAPDVRTFNFVFPRPE